MSARHRDPTTAASDLPPDATGDERTAIGPGDRVIHRGVAYTVRRREGNHLDLEAEGPWNIVHHRTADVRLVVLAPGAAPAPAGPVGFTREGGAA